MDDLFTSMGLESFLTMGNNNNGDVTTTTTIGSHVKGNRYADHTPKEQKELILINEEKDQWLSVLENPNATSDQKSEALQKLYALQEREKSIKKKALKRKPVLKEDDEDDSVKKSKTTDKAPDVELFEWQETVRETVRQGMQPLFDMIGAVQLRLGGKSDVEHYRKKGKGLTYEDRTSIVVVGAPTERQFYAENKFLGTQLLEIFYQLRSLQIGRPIKNIGARNNECPEVLQRPSIEEMRGIVGDDAQRFGNEWVWSALPERAIAMTTTDTMYAAMHDAHARLIQLPNMRRVTLKQILASPKVRHTFSSMIVYYAKRGGGMAYPGRIYADGNGNPTGGNFTIGTGMTNRRDLDNSMVGAVTWFERAYRTRNPCKTEFEELIDQELDMDKRTLLRQIWNVMEDYVITHPGD